MADWRGMGGKERRRRNRHRVYSGVVAMPLLWCVAEHQDRKEGEEKEMKETQKSKKIITERA